MVQHSPESSPSGAIRDGRDWRLDLEYLGFDRLTQDEVLAAAEEIRRTPCPVRSA